MLYISFVNSTQITVSFQQPQASLRGRLIQDPEQEPVEEHIVPHILLQQQQVRDPEQEPDILQTQLQRQSHFGAGKHQAMCLGFVHQNQHLLRYLPQRLVWTQQLRR